MGLDTYIGLACMKISTCTCTCTSTGTSTDTSPTEGLQQVVLDDVADDAKPVEVAAAPARAWAYRRGLQAG